LSISLTVTNMFWWSFNYS